MSSMSNAMSQLSLYHMYVCIKYANIRRYLLKVASDGPCMLKKSDKPTQV